MNLASGCSGLPLVLTIVGSHSRMVKLGKHKLPHSSASSEKDGVVAGIEQLKGDFTFKSRINPPGILNEEANSANGASSLNECGDIRRELDILLGSGKHKLLGLQDELVTGNPIIGGGSIKGDYLLSVEKDGTQKRVP